MPSEDRQDLATAAVGGTGLGVGGVMRHKAVTGIKPVPKVHLIGVLRNGTKGQKKLFAAGSALGLVSAVPLGVGVTRFATGRDEVDKALKVTGVRRVAGEWGVAQPHRGDLELALKQARQLRNSAGRLRNTSLSEVLTGTRGRLAKRDQDERGFWSEGLRGSASALRQRGENVVQPVPAKVRGAQLGVAAGSGFAGSAVARALLPKGAGPVAGPIAGALAATGSLPLTNKIVSRHGYVVTPYGAKRMKTAPVRPSSKATRHRPETRSLRQDLAKKDTDYLGARTSYPAQRAAVTAANRTPLVGNFLSTGVASRYAPPGQERKAGVRQFAMGSAAPMAAGVGGAYGGAHWADTSDRGLKAATGVINAKDKVERSVRSAVRMGPKKPMNPAGWRARQLARVAQSRLGKPLLKSPRATIGAIGGFVGAKAIAGTVGEQSAITLNQHDQSAYNRKHKINKAAGGVAAHYIYTQAPDDRPAGWAPRLGNTDESLGISLKADGRKYARQGRRVVAAAHQSVADRPGIRRGGVGVYGKISLRHGKQWARDMQLDAEYAALGSGHINPIRNIEHDLLSARRAYLAPRTAAGAAALGMGAYALHRSKNKRQVAKLASDQGTKRERHRLAERKRLNAALAYTSGGLGLTGLGLMAAGKHPVAMKTSILAGGVGGTNSLIGAGVQRREATQVDPHVAKRDYKEPLKTSISEDDARHLIERHGLTGTLPKELDREQRRAAYEARYVTAGGHKAENWQHRAVQADKAKMAGLGVATAAGVPWLGARTRAGRRLGTAVARHVPALRKVRAPRVEHHAENVAGTAAVAAGGAELYAAHARRKRSSYASAPAGVAASALRRMQAYDTEAS